MGRQVVLPAFCDLIKRKEEMKGVSSVKRSPPPSSLINVCTCTHKLDPLCFLDGGCMLILASFLKNRFSSFGLAFLNGHDLKGITIGWYVAVDSSWVQMSPHL